LLPITSNNTWAADAQRKHFGFTIVAGLAKGLNGTFEHESRGGLVTRVRFPLDGAHD